MTMIAIAIPSSMYPGAFCPGVALGESSERYLEYEAFGSEDEARARAEAILFGEPETGLPAEVADQAQSLEPSEIKPGAVNSGTGLLREVSPSQDLPRDFSAGK